MRIVIAILALIVLTGCATGGGLSGDSPLGQFVRADVQRGLEIATAANDIAGVNCAAALLKAMPEAEAPELAAAGAFSALIKARELRRRVSAGVDEAVHIACSPLIVDAEKVLARFGLMAVPGGGVLGGILR